MVSTFKPFNEPRGCQSNLMKELAKKRKIEEKYANEFSKNSWKLEEKFVRCGGVAGLGSPVISEGVSGRK